MRWSLLREDNASPATPAGMLPPGPHSQTTRAGLGVKRSRVQKLETLLDLEADDRELMRQVISFYHETLKASPEALRYLERRGLRDEASIERFRFGYANRTLGYRLPSKLNATGQELRGRLQQLGLGGRQRIMKFRPAADSRRVCLSITSTIMMAA